MYSESQFRRIRLLERFLLKMERRYYVSEEDLERFPFVRERNWDVVYKLLREHGVVKEEIKVRQLYICVRGESRPRNRALVALLLHPHPNIARSVLLTSPTLNASGSNSGSIHSAISSYSSWSGSARMASVS